MKTFTNILVTLTFTLGCLTFWVLLKWLDSLSSGAMPLPGFTQLFVDERSTLLILPFLAIGACIWTCFQGRKPEHTSVPFIACTLSGLFLISFPVVMAVFLPMLMALDRMK